MKQHRIGRHPLFIKIFLPIFFLMILQSAIFFFATVYGGIIDAMNENASDILTERVINRENEIETRFNTHLRNTTKYAEEVDNCYRRIRAESDSAIYADDEAQKELLGETSPILINMLRNNEVNGVFLILNDAKDYVPLREGEVQEKYGLCIRDYEPNSGYTDKEDLLVVRCPSSIIPTVGCSLETWWEARYTFEQDYNNDFYYKPLEAAYKNPDVSVDNLAYFCTTHHLAYTDRTVVSYSIPLIDGEGYPYGVLGIELTTTYLESLLPSGELHGRNEGSYALVQYQEGSSEFQVLAHDGIIYQQGIGNGDTFVADKWQEENLISVKGKNKMLLRAGISNLKIYNKNTPFENEKLALIGMVEQDTLYAFGHSITKRLFIVAMLGLYIGMMGIFLVSRRLTAPIKGLADKVRGMKGEKELVLERINIDEIDELVNALEEMSRNINRNQVRTEFFSRMSHDMRTPMNAIIGFSSPEILKDAPEEEKDEYLEKIQASGVYLLGLINEVLDMTKIDSNRMEVKEEAVLAKDIWKNGILIIEEVAQQKGIHMEVEIEDEDIYMLADRQRISQIFVNLLSNAVKFTPEGGKVSFKVSILERDEEKVVHRIEIKDNGIGMSEEFQKNLYEPFTQEYAGLVEGTGLGLSITKQLVELMGGRISCKSQLGKGTQFTLILTNHMAQSPEKEMPDGKEKRQERKQLQGKRVLVCEDHPLNLQIARKLLEKAGILVETAQNGVIGAEKFTDSEEGYYTWILMDIRMPEMDGLEATRVIRASEHKEARTIPIIAMTANAFSEDVQETAEAGMNEHLSKPIEPEKLYQTLAKFI